ncbi:MAG: hypothetical protein C1942_05395 [Prosthecochloris sp.]|uniref:hypothetical protein n=1 Tax=Prosthecochloris sp. TaxID=290513 RepID=UPI0013CBCF29|nr:hypothetical protein [Prosthecochloris sp.]NEX12122.1 hypothetical protein [Prosthecochloris sp.]
MMVPQEAEKIIQAYTAVLGSGTDGGVARKLSSLPCSKCRIRYAYYVYLTYLTEHGEQYKELIDKIMVTYAALPQFIPDQEAEIVNSIFAGKRDQTAITDEETKRYADFHNKAFDPGQLVEIEAFVHECFMMKAKQN